MYHNGRTSVRRMWDSRIDSPYWPFRRPGQFVSSDLPTKLYPAGTTPATSRQGAGGTSLPKARNWGGRRGIRTHDLTSVTCHQVTLFPRSKTLTPISRSRFQRLSLVLPLPRGRCVPATGILEAEVTLDSLALERTKQV